MLNSLLILTAASLATGLSMALPGKAEGASPKSFAEAQSDICRKILYPFFCVDREDVIKADKGWNFDDKKRDLYEDASWTIGPASGRRFWDIKDNSYEMRLQGKASSPGPWNGGLIDANPDIPTKWKGNYEYLLPTDYSVFNFTKEYSVKKDYLGKNDPLCPKGERIAGCRFVKAYAAASVQLGGNLFASGDISTDLIFTEENLFAKASIERETSLLMNNKLAETLTTDMDDQLVVNLTDTNGLKITGGGFEAGVKVFGVSNLVAYKADALVTGTFVFNDKAQKSSTVNAEYFESAYSNFIETSDKTIKLTLNDSIAMNAGYKGDYYTSASVFAQQRLQNPQSAAFTVFVVEEVPAPVPLFGAGAFIAYSRKLRSRLKSNKN